VVSALGDVVTSAELYSALGVTIRRILIAWSIAYVLGLVWGLAAARSRVADGVMRPWMLVGLALPSPVAVLFSVLLLGLSETSALLGLVLITLPFVANIVYENAKAVPTGLIQMGKAYRLGFLPELRHIYLPHLGPALLSGARLGLQLSWKMIVVMEAIARPDGIGAQLSFFYKVLRPDHLVAYTVVFGLLLGAVELLIFRPISGYVFRWRGEAKVV
jgi:NitT/TauT family transport system permease protein